MVRLSYVLSMPHCIKTRPGSSSLYSLVGLFVLACFLALTFRRTSFAAFSTGLACFRCTPARQAWDWKFSRQDEQWVLVTLKNGDTITGFYGKESFSASTPDERDIYIQWIYDTDAKGTSPTPQEKGVYIGAGEISTIEFWPFSNSEESNGQED